MDFKKITKAAFLLLAALVVSSFTFRYSKFDKQDNSRVHKSISKTFMTNTYSLSPFVVNKKEFLVIQENDSILGYTIITEAPSQYHHFDYYILFNTKAEVLKIEILQYRENYGAEICSKRWLKKFFKISTEDYLEYNRNINAISGATISVNSLKQDVFKITNILKKGL